MTTFNNPTKDAVHYRASLPFTPGPWWACCIDDDYERNCHCGYIFTSGNGEGTIGRVYYNDPKLPDTFEPREDTITLAQRNSNACLLAASPTLFWALRKALSALETQENVVDAIQCAVIALDAAKTMRLDDGESLAQVYNAIQSPTDSH